VMPFIDNNGIKINYSIIDECDGEYLLLHTGLNSTKEAWIELSYTEELKKHWKIILIDPRGHGESDKPRDLAKYSFKLMADDVNALLDHLKINKVHFFGYSLGGLVGWQMIVHYPERLISFVAGGSRVKFPPDRPNAFLRLSFLQEGPIENANTPTQPYDIEHLLPSIKIPVLTFVGDKDTSCYSFVVEYSKLIPNCKTFVLPGLNHPQAMMEKDKVLPRVIAFLKEN
ncbi:MAG: alpha/beta hydrolase, partial [Asgard group archaeon]|nr:alpha/beta hydrolase [Asgard group archaeon]